MILVPGSNSLILTQKLSGICGSPIAEIENRRFSDNEIYLRIKSSLKGETCTVIHSTYSNDALTELFLLLDLVGDLGSGSITAVIPYMGYARQDKRFREGEALSAKTMLKIIDQFTDTIITLNCHFLNDSGELTFHGIKIRNLDAFPLLGKYFRDKTRDPVLIAPDKGAVNQVKKASNVMGCEFDYLEKTRISDHEVEFALKKLDVEAKDAIILDDMIATGGTVIEASRFLRSQGARTVSVGCVHGVFSEGIGKIRESVDELVCTDTINTKASRITVSDLIAKHLMS